MRTVVVHSFIEHLYYILALYAKAKAHELMVKAWMYSALKARGCMGGIHGHRNGKRTSSLGNVCVRTRVCVSLSVRVCVWVGGGLVCV